MPQSLQIDWIDYSSRDRNKILSILSLLYTPEAVDELGINRSGDRTARQGTGQAEQ
jgi:hypothetical protein